MYARGALKDVRKPDELVKFYVPRAVLVPDIGDWSYYNCRAYNQRNISECVGASDMELICNGAARLGIIPPGLPIFFSPTYIYNLARKKRGWLNDDCGCMPEDAADAICESGVVLYTDWPNRYTKTSLIDIVFDKSDPELYAQKAIYFPEMTKYRVDKGVDGLLGALADGVVSIAVPWFDHWDSSYKSGVLPPITGRQHTSRHNITFDGWNKQEGMFYGPNTWGIWGIKESAQGERRDRCGFKMPFEYIEQFKKDFGGYDAWDFHFGKLPPLPNMMLPVNVLSGGNGSYGSGTYAPGSRVQISAGDFPGYDFICWYPNLGLDNPWSKKTTVEVLDVLELSANFKQAAPRKRCPMFDVAKTKNRKEGIS